MTKGCKQYWTTPIKKESIVLELIGKLGKETIEPIDWNNSDKNNKIYLALNCRILATKSNTKTYKIGNEEIRKELNSEPIL